MRYRTRPIEFRAFRWTGQPLETFPDWFKTRSRLRDLMLSAHETFLGFQHGAKRIVVEKGSWICLSEDQQFYQLTDDFMQRIATPIDEAMANVEKEA